MDIQYEQAIRVNQDRINHAFNIIKEEEREIASAKKNILMLKTYEQVLLPYLEEAVKNTKVSGHNVSFGQMYYDVVFKVPATEMHTRFVLKPTEDLENAELKLALSYTWCPLRQTAPPYDIKSSYEDLPDAKNLISRVGEICWMSIEERKLKQNQTNSETKN